MATEILVKNGTPIVFADGTDFSSSNSGFTRTAQIDLTSLASLAAAQSDKVDLGDKRAAMFAVRVGIELDVAPAATMLIEFYWSASHHATAGTGNEGGASGADGAYKNGEEREWVAQLQHLGNLSLTADAAPTVQCATIGFLIPSDRYGQLIVLNSSDQALEGDAVEMYIALIAQVTESQ